VISSGLFVRSALSFFSSSIVQIIVSRRRLQVSIAALLLLYAMDSIAVPTFPFFFPPPEDN